MSKAVLSVCGLCVLSAYFDLLFKGGRFYKLMRISVALHMLSLLLSILRSIF